MWKCVKFLCSKFLILFLDCVCGYVCCAGNDVATEPQNFVLSRLGEHSTLVPGIEAFNITVQLKDGLGQIVKGSSLVPNTRVVTALVCDSGSVKCTISSSLNRQVFFLPFDLEDPELKTVNSKVCCTA